MEINDLGLTFWQQGYLAIDDFFPADITDICVYRNMLYQFSTSTVLEDRSF